MGSNTNASYTNIHLASKLESTLQNVSGLVKSTVKSSRSLDILASSCKNFASVEQNIENTSDIVNKLTHLATHLGYQQQAISSHLKQLDLVKEQLQTVL